MDVGVDEDEALSKDYGHVLVLDTIHEYMYYKLMDLPLHRPALLDSFFLMWKPRTREAYRQDLEDFGEFFGVGSVEELAAQLVTLTCAEAQERVLAYRAHLVSRGLAGATINRRLAALRGLVRVARTLGLVTWSIEIRGERVIPYRDTRGPGREGFVAMLQILDARRGSQGSRDRALIRLLYDLGLRRAEVVSLDLEHLDLGRGTISVLGKGRGDRERLSLPRPTADAIAAWVAVRGSSPGPLFVALDYAHAGGRLSASSIYWIVRKLGEDAGLKVRPQGLRHAAITEALNITRGNIRAVQRFSRHRDVRVLLTYDDNRQDLGGDIARKLAAGA